MIFASTDVLSQIASLAALEILVWDAKTMTDRMMYASLMELVERRQMMREYIMQVEVGNAPITVQELVRCKDCKHNSLTRLSGNVFCDYGIGLYQLNDFCAKGERKETEDGKIH